MTSGRVDELAEQAAHGVRATRDEVEFMTNGSYAMIRIARDGTVVISDDVAIAGDYEHGYMLTSPACPGGWASVNTSGPKVYLPDGGVILVADHVRDEQVRRAVSGDLS